MSAGALQVERTIGTVHWQVASEHRDLLLGPEGLRLPEWLHRGQAQIVKHGPHRTVYRVVLPELSFYVKHYRLNNLRAWLRELVRPSKARMEYERARAVAERGVPTFVPLALGECRDRLGPNDSFLITQTLVGTEPLSQFLDGPFAQFDPGTQARVRQRLAVALAELLAKLHDAGIRHQDLHPGNLLIRSDAEHQPELFLIDLHAAQVGSPLGWRASRANLILLNRWGVMRAHRSDRLRFWRAYCRARNTGDFSRILPSPSVLRGRGVGGEGGLGTQLIGHAWHAASEERPACQACPTNLPSPTEYGGRGVEGEGELSTQYSVLRSPSSQPSPPCTGERESSAPSPQPLSPEYRGEGLAAAARVLFRERAAEVELATWQSNLRFWHSRDRRCLTSNRYFRRVRSPIVVGHAVADLPAATLAPLLADPDAPFRQPEAILLKNSRSSTVAELELAINGQMRRVIYKRFRVTSWSDPWTSLVRPTPALRSWYYGHGLLERSVPTARPLAVLHRKKRGLLHEGYLLTEKIPDAQELLAFVTNLRALPPALRQHLLRRCTDLVARLIRDLHRRQLSHRDLKAVNLLVSGKQGEESVWLIDLVGVRRHRSLSRDRRVQNLTRLHVSFFRDPLVTRTDKLRFLRTYLQWGLHGKEGWKQWWREIEAATEAKVARNSRHGRPLA